MRSLVLALGFALVSAPATADTKIGPQSWVLEKLPIGEGRMKAVTKPRDEGKNFYEIVVALCKERKLIIEGSLVRDHGYTIKITDDPPRSDVLDHLVFKAVCPRR